MTSTSEKPATPLIPAIAGQAVHTAMAVTPAPADGGQLQIIEDAVVVDVQPAMSPSAPAPSLSEAAAAPAVVAAKTPAAPEPASAPDGKNSEKTTAGRIGRTMQAASATLNLAALGALAAIAFDVGHLQTAATGAMFAESRPADAAIAKQVAPPVVASGAHEERQPSAATQAAPEPTPPEPAKTAALPLPAATPATVREPSAAPASATSPEAATVTPAAAPASTVLPNAQPANSASPGTPRPANATPAVATEPVAAPSLLAAEIEHVARFDALIAPVRDALPTLEDATRLRDAMATTANPQQTRALRDQLAEPAARKLIDWALARGGSGSALDIKAFLEKNSQWPNHDLLVQRSEEQLFVSGGSVRDIKSFFDKGTPKTGIGMAALASAFLAEGDEAQAKQLAGAAWRRSDIPGSLETGFLERFSRILSEADHKARFDRYMIDNTRWTNDRNERATVARRAMSHLTGLERQKAEARLAAYLRQSTADAPLAALPADAMTVPKPDWGLAFQLAQWHRRAGRYDAALKILNDVPADAAIAGNLDEWWEERRLAAYDGLKAGRPKVAYELVKAPGALSVNQAKDQTFLAGWIALRHLNDPKAAEQHFAAFEAVADGPLSRAKAGYWLARTFEAQKAPDKMKAPLERAARNIDTFYGQLARLELNPKQTAIKITPPRTPTPEEAQRFNNNELVRAVVLARKSNLEQTVTRALLARLSLTLATEAEQGLLAHLAEALGDPQMAVRIGKSAIARGYNLMLYAYPINAMPAYQALRTPPEMALVLGVTRQESEFDTTIISGAGARGLMQVMPITAQHVCRDYRVKCEIERLSRDPAYNAMMASAYIADRMDEFQGSYVLTIAGYNAGPGRVRQWIKEFGDPRAANADPLDWIHRIPFEETREYVQKVLSNMQIYRARLGDEANALRLTTDLRRVAIAPPRKAAATPTTAAPAANN